MPRHIKVRNLLTRRQVVAVWQLQSEDMLDTKCCPSCRDLLCETIDGTFYCLNCDTEYEES